MTDKLAPFRGVTAHPQAVRKITGDIDAVMQEDGRDGWCNETLGPAANVVAWVENPGGVSTAILSNLTRFTGLIRRGARVVDVGCHLGYAYDWLYRAVGPIDYVGIDVHPEAIAAAREIHAHDLGEGAAFEVGDLYAPSGPLGNVFEPFDAALCLRVLCHTPDLRHGLKTLLGLAPVVLASLKIGTEDCAYEMRQGDKRHFFRIYTEETVSRAAERAGASRHEIHRDKRFASLVMWR